MTERVIRQLGGSIDYDWRVAGVTVRLRLSVERLGL